MNKLTVMRALTARIGRRAIKLVTRISLIFVGTLVVLTIGLVYLFSPWWWLLLVPVVILFVIVFLLRMVASFIVRRIHNQSLNAQQRDGLDTFIGHIQQLLETRATPSWIFAIITIKDIVLHRDITTIKKIISDSAGLRQEYNELEKLF